jgi:photosystem II stability/assembly factor-like uncharacterized protein
MKRLNKVYLVFLILFFSMLSFAQRTSEWERLISPTNETLRKLYFVDKNNGWAVSLGGKIINTIDAGETWHIQNSTVTTPIVDIFFINPNRGWALTYPSEPPFGTSILKTTNGGLDWIKDSVFFENEIFTTIFFLDENTGFVGGKGVKKTIDGGLTWLNSFIEPGGVSTLPINKFSFYSNTFGYACGGRVDVAGVVWRTTDGGNNWSSIGLSPDQIYDVFVFDSLNAISLSGDPELLYPIGVIKTTDGGITWAFTELPFFGISFAIDFLNQNEGWSVSGYKFLRTSDGGNTWFGEPTPDSAIVYDIQFVDQYTGFACGEGGALLKFTSFKKPQVDKPTFELMQNYPNPFSEKTTIRFTVLSQDSDVPTRVKIKLFDILGNELSTLVDEEFYWGFYESELNPAKQNLALSSGVYIISLISGDCFISKKLIYLK